MLTGVLVLCSQKDQSVSKIFLHDDHRLLATTIHMYVYNGNTTVYKKYCIYKDLLLNFKLLGISKKQESTSLTAAD